MDKEMIVFCTGYNGNSTFSLLTKEGKPIYTKMTLKDLAKNIVRTYPDLSRKIWKYLKEDFSGNFPEELNLSRLDPSPKTELIEQISKIIDLIQ